MILYLVLFSLVSELIEIVVNKRRYGKKLLHIKEFLFYYSIYYFGVSAVKTYLGDAEYTLVESFWDMEGMTTYIHYGMPLLIVSIGLPVLLRIFDRRGFRKRLISVYVGVIYIGLLLVCMCFGTISNMHYVMVFIVSVIVSMVVAFVYKGDVESDNELTIKNDLLDIFPGVLSLIFMIGMYLPNELYLENISEFKAPYIEFFIILLVGSIVLAVAFSICSIIAIPNRVLGIFSHAVVGIAIMGYVQMMFLNGELEMMNGEAQTWKTTTVIVNLIIWVVALAVIVIGGSIKAILSKIFKGICIYIFLIQMVTLGYLVLTSDVDTSIVQEAMTTEGSLELSPDNNILVFVLDAFDISYMDEIMEEDENFTNDLSDFVYYNNTSCLFAHTYLAIPYLLDDVKWDSENDTYYKTGSDNMIEKLSQNGYDVGIYTESQYVSEELQNISSNYDNAVAIHCNAVKTLEVMLKSSLYKIMPFTAKSTLSYYSADMDEIVKMDSVWSISDDSLFYNDLSNNGLSISSDSDGTFRFYHMRGPHEPYYLSDDMKVDRKARGISRKGQARASLRIVYKYMDQLKELGIYDSATIIITADHGHTAETEGDTVSLTSEPIMFVKEAYSKGDEMKVSSAPVSQDEIFPTILRAAGIEANEYGRTFSEIGEEEKRIREYIDLYSNYMIRYKIDGNVKDIESWSIEKYIVE